MITKNTDFIEAQIMAKMAVNRQSCHILPESFWQSAMISLKEAYGKNDQPKHNVTFFTRVNSVNCR